MFEAEKFFPNCRREMTVAMYNPLKTSGGEDRKKIAIEMPLEVEGTQIGMPELFHNAWDWLLKNEEATSGGFGDLEVKAVTLQIYSTEKTRTRAVLLTGCTMNKFSIKKVGKGEDAACFLCFTLYAPDSEALHSWLRNHFRASFWSDFEITQQEMKFAEKPAAEASKKSKGDQATLLQ